ncbi:MAG TPA: LPS export ABC transporter permease LptF [Nitrospirota bacterium]|nr:LPS export ABC transporter permease LptF [Nitrospirota bacterium]
MLKIRIMDRYIFREILAPFFLSMAALILVLFLQRMFRLAELVVSKGTPVSEIVKIFAYIMPNFLVITIPMSFLVATLTAFSRLSSDSEVTAMKASRISLYSMTRPVMLFALVSFLVTSTISFVVAPAANHALKVHLFELVKSRALIGIEPGVFTSTFDGMVIYVDKMESIDNMEGIFISDERSAKDPYAIVARRGKLIADPQSLNVTLEMHQGSIYTLPRDEKSYSTMSFESGNLYLDISHALIRQGSSERDFEEIGSFELFRILRRTAAEGGATLAIENELHKRLSIPFACLIFGLIGAPLGIRRTRSGKSAGIAIALLVFLVYYIVLATGMNLSETGKLSPVLAYWIPNFLMLILAVLFMIKRGQEKDLRIFAALGDLYSRLKTGRKKTF